MKSVSEARPVSAKGVEKEKISLECVTGNTASKRSLASHPITGDFAYPAGHVVVMNSKENKQSRFFTGGSFKPIECISFSRNGKYLIAGEEGTDVSCLIFELDNNASSKPIAEISSQHSLLFCALSPNNSFLILLSLSNENDSVTYLKIWDWMDSKLLYETTINNIVQGFDYSRDGSYFVVCGAKFVEYFYFDGKSPTRFSAKLGEFEREEFVDVVCSRALSISPLANFCFSLTSSGKLLALDSSKTLEKWVDLKMPSASSLSILSNSIAIAGANGLCRIFTADTFKHLCTLPKHAKLLSTIAVCLCSEGDMAVCVYSDRLMNVYHFANKLVEMKWTASVHFKEILDISIVKSDLSGISSVVGSQTDRNSKHGRIPSNSVSGSLTERSTFKDAFSVVTCGEDNTVRFWNDKVELVHTLEFDDSHSIRCLAVSPGQDFLATGDGLGKIRVHSISDFTLLDTIDAHSECVTSLSFCNSSSDDLLYLASGSMDKSICVFSISKIRTKHSKISRLIDHSTAITKVAFASNNSRLLSLGDNLIFRSVSFEDSAPIFPQVSKCLVPNNCDSFALHPNGKFAVTCGDNKMQIWNLSNGKMARSYALADAINSNSNLSSSSNVHLVCLDPSGLFAVTASSDGFLRLYDWLTGKLLSRFKGHCEQITAMTFNRDGTNLFSVAKDGCIYKWALASSISMAIAGRLIELATTPTAEKISLSAFDDVPLKNSLPADKPSETSKEKTLSTEVSEKVVRKASVESLSVSEQHIDMANGIAAQKEVVIPVEDSSLEVAGTTDSKKMFSSVSVKNAAPQVSSKDSVKIIAVKEIVKDAAKPSTTKKSEISKETVKESHVSEDPVKQAFNDVDNHSKSDGKPVIESVASNKPVSLSALAKPISPDVSHISTDFVFKPNLSPQTAPRSPLLNSKLPPVSPMTSSKLAPVMTDVPVWARSVAPNSMAELVESSTPSKKESNKISLNSASRPESRWAQRVKNDEFKIFSEEPNKNDALLMSMSVDDFMSTLVPDLQSEQPEDQFLIPENKQETHAPLKPITKVSGIEDTYEDYVETSTLSENKPKIESKESSVHSKSEVLNEKLTFEEAKSCILAFETSFFGKVSPFVNLTDSEATLVRSQLFSLHSKIAEVLSLPNQVVETKTSLSTQSMEELSNIVVLKLEKSMNEKIERIVTDKLKTHKK